MHMYAAGLIRPWGDEDCAQGRLIVFYLMVTKGGEMVRWLIQSTEGRVRVKLSVALI